MKLWEFWDKNRYKIEDLDADKLYSMIAFLTGYLGLNEISYDAIKVLERYLEK